MVTEGGRLTSTLRETRTDQREGNKVPIDGYYFGLLNSPLRPPHDLHHSLPSTGPRQEAERGQMCRSKYSLSVFLLLLAAADGLRAAFREQ